MSSNSDPDSLLREENQKLKTAVEELAILNDIATAITSTQSLEKIILHPTFFHIDSTVR